MKKVNNHSRYARKQNTNPSVPVIIQRGEKQIINVGVSQNDMSKIKINQKTNVKLNNESREGTVTNIQKSPNNKTNLYMIDIEIIDEFSQADFLVGAIADVSMSAAIITTIYPGLLLKI